MASTDVETKCMCLLMNMNNIILCNTSRRENHSLPTIFALVLPMKHRRHSKHTRVSDGVTATGRMINDKTFSFLPRFIRISHINVKKKCMWMYETESIDRRWKQTIHKWKHIVPEVVLKRLVVEATRKREIKKTSYPVSFVPAQEHSFNMVDCYEGRKCGGKFISIRATYRRYPSGCTTSTPDYAEKWFITSMWWIERDKNPNENRLVHSVFHATHRAQMWACPTRVYGIVVGSPVWYLKWNRKTISSILNLERMESVNSI